MNFINKVYNHLIWRYNRFLWKIKIKKLKFGYFGKKVIFGFPSVISNPKQVYLYDYCNLHQRHIIYNYTGKFIMKEYSVASIDLLVVTGNHTPTVGIPFYSSAMSHINDKETDIILEEDVWIGARVTLLAEAHIGRGAIIGANSLVNKEIPPYAVAVGTPAKIIAAKFTIEQILEHEKLLYPEEKRFTKEYLEELFETYYKDKRTIGVTSDLKEVGFFGFMDKNNIDYIK